MNKIFRVLGRKGNTTVPFAIRIKSRFKPGDVISYYLSQLPLYVDSKYQSEKQIQGLNTPNADVFMPIEEAKSHLKDLAFTLPYSRQVKEQAQKGTLYEKTTDKKFQSRITEIARKVVEYDAD